MTLNRQLFRRDPTDFVIPNDGIATVGAPNSDHEWNVLRYELQSFVCEGQYRAGLQHILATYLDHLPRDRQPAVWVSGFYGSGKSHLVRMLEHYWRNVQLPGGAAARSLSSLPPDIVALLDRLSAEAAARGGLWAAAGKMSNAGGEGGIRADILRIVLESAGLPVKYPAARFVLWLQQQGLYDDVRRRVEAAGADFDDELPYLYASSVLAESLLAVRPSFADSETHARDILRDQFPVQGDVSHDELFDTTRLVLQQQSTQSGQIPCTLLVLDELQQAIGEDAGRTLAVQAIVEDLCTRLGSRLLVVATGQSAVSATRELQKLQGRFTVRVELSDRDVDAVVREVVLRKDPARVAELQAALEAASGEIDRHVADSRIAPTAADRADLAADYPILPTRRRFWERILRVIGTGQQSQLRGQLQTVHRASRAVADRPLGTVVGADFIYEQHKPAMLAGHDLSRETAIAIDTLNDGTPDGRLAGRLCALIFLIDRLPTEGVLAARLHANAATLADLLVEDLRHDGPELRRRVPALLADLVEGGKLVAVDGVYRIQTPTGSEWEENRRQQFNRIKADTPRIAADRAEALKAAVIATLKPIRLLHGANKTPRKMELHFGPDAPSANGTAVPVWVRDEWSVTDKSVRDDAQRAGPDSPIVFVLLPRVQAEALTNALAGAAAARAVLAARPLTPQASAEAHAARDAMESKARAEERRMADVVAEVLRGGHVYQGGGNEVVLDNLAPADEPTLAATVTQAAENALARLFPNFNATDTPGWDKVVHRGGQGATDALTVIGHNEAVDRYAPAAEVLAYLGAAGQKGSDVRARFTGPGYGWPQDCVDGLLLALLNADLAGARNKSGAPVAARHIPQSSIGVTTFFRQSFVLTAAQRIALRALAQPMGVVVAAGEEAAAVRGLLERLVALAGEASGTAPLPARPDTAHLETLRAYAGNEQLMEVYNARDRLAADFKAWRALADKKADRHARWQLLESLMAHADALPDAARLRAEMAAIRDRRALLEDPDPVKPLLDEAAAGLRAALQEARAAVVEARQRELTAIEATPEWNALPDEAWHTILENNKLGPVDTLDVSTDERLVAALNAKPVSAWGIELEAIPTRVRHARDRAAKQLAPKAVRVRPTPRTLTTPAEADAYLAELRAEIVKHLDEGHPVIISLT